MLVLPSVPDWLRILGSLATVLSFVPQLHRICSTKDSSGLSLYYILFNLLLATEGCSIFFLFLVNETDSHGVSIQNHPTVGDWLNLCQVSVVWVLFMILFLLTVRFRSRDHIVHKRITVSVYVVYLLISVIPLLCDFLFGIFHDPYGDLDWRFSIIFGLGHMFYILPALTLLSLISVVFQARLIWKHKAPALSIPGLAIQAIVFAVIAAMWLGRVKYSDTPMKPVPTLLAFFAWFITVGWPAVDSLVFATVQGVLYGLAVYTARHSDRVDEDAIHDGESEPLLGQDSSVDAAEGS